MRSTGILGSGLVWVASLDSGYAARGGNAQLETTLPMDAATFARLARSQEFYRSTRAAGELSKQEVVHLGEWVPWEFQSEDEESPSDSENSSEVVPNPPPPCKAAGAALSGMKGGGLSGVQGMPGAPISGEEEQRKNSGAVGPNGQGPQQMLRRMRHMYTSVVSPALPLPQWVAGAGAGGGGNGGGDQSARIFATQAFFSNVARRTGPFLRPREFRRLQGVAQGQEAQQMYRKVRLRYAVSSPMGSSHSDGAQGHTLREGEDEVIYTETDCISGLPMFRGDLVVKTTYRVTRDEDDPNNSVRVKVTVVVRDVKLARAVGWLSKGIKMVIRDSGKKQAANTLEDMVKAKATPGLRKAKAVLQILGGHRKRRLVEGSHVFANFTDDASVKSSHLRRLLSDALSLESLDANEEFAACLAEKDCAECLEIDTPTHCVTRDVEAINSETCGDVKNVICCVFENDQRCMTNAYFTAGIESLEKTCAMDLPCLGGNSFEDGLEAMGTSGDNVEGDAAAINALDEAEQDAGAESSGAAQVGSSSSVGLRVLVALSALLLVTGRAI
eukprot:g2063.t2